MAGAGPGRVYIRADPAGRRTGLQGAPRVTQGKVTGAHGVSRSSATFLAPYAEWRRWDVRMNDLRNERGTTGLL
jgi:hypothetical protein